MKLLFDTSVLVAGLVRAHPDHERAFAWLERVRLQEIQGVVSAHTLAELYGILTRLPLLEPPLSPAEAARCLDVDIDANFEIIELSRADYREAVRALTELGIPGGAIYDALIAQCAVKCAADQLLTLNPKHFDRFGPFIDIQVVTP